MKITSYKYAKEKGLKRYFTGIPCKNSHISERLTSSRGCIECQKKNEKKYNQSEKGKKVRRLKQKRFYKNNREKILAKEKIRTKTPKYKKRVKAYNQRSYVREKKKKYNENYFIENQEQIREKNRQYNKNVRRKNKDYLLKENIRRRILIALKSKSIVKKKSLLDLIGCSIPQFKKHIKEKFYKNPDTGEMMTWENHGLKTWHIDHIKPLDWFNLKKLSEQKKAFNYKNCTPKWSKENLSKGARFIG